MNNTMDNINFDDEPGYEPWTVDQWLAIGDALVFTGGETDLADGRFVSLVDTEQIVEINNLADAMNQRFAEGEWLAGERLETISRRYHALYYGRESI